MANTVFEVLVEKIEEDITAKEAGVASGACKDYAEYREVCGTVRGLRFALSHILDLSRAYLDDNDD